MQSGNISYLPTYTKCAYTSNIYIYVYAPTCVKSVMSSLVGIRLTRYSKWSGLGQCGREMDELITFIQLTFITSMYISMSYFRPQTALAVLWIATVETPIRV